MIKSGGSLEDKDMAHTPTMCTLDAGIHGITSIEGWKAVYGASCGIVDIPFWTESGNLVLPTHHSSKKDPSVPSRIRPMLIKFIVP
jgi:hypothetical protein